MNARVYLDWNAGAPLLPEAKSAVAVLLGRGHGNPSSVHDEGRAARRLVEDARSSVAALVAARPDEIVFTSGGSEANATAVLGQVATPWRSGGRDVALPRVEHPSLLAAAERAARLGSSLRWLPVDRRGVVDLEASEAILAGGEIALVCIQLANSETGVLQPVARLAALAHACGAVVHCDAVQAVGKVPVAAGALGVDSISLSAHKIGGLSGTGAVAILGDAVGAPLIPGSQERHRRGGTENTAGIVAFGAAARAALPRLEQWKATSGLRDWIEGELRARIDGLRIVGGGSERLPNTMCLCLPQPLAGGVTVAALDLAGFAVSSGSACSSGVGRASTVAEAMGFTHGESQRTLRVSVGPETSDGEAEAFVGALVDVVRRQKGGRA